MRLARACRWWFVRLCGSASSRCRPERRSPASDRLADQRWFRVLTVVDQFTRECILLLADRSLTAAKVAAALDRVVAERGTPESITVDNGSEFASSLMDRWAHLKGI